MTDILIAADARCDVTNVALASRVWFADVKLPNRPWAYLEPSTVLRYYDQGAISFGDGKGQIFIAKKGSDRVYTMLPDNEVADFLARQVR